MGPDGLVYPNWRNVGVEGGIPTITGPIFEVAGPSGGGDTSMILAKIEEADAAGGGVVQLQSGTYLLDRPLTIIQDNIVLRGQGRDETKLQFVYRLGLKELRWFTPASDGDDTYLEDLLELHFSGVAAKSIRFKVDGIDVPTSTWSWDAPDGNHIYSTSRILRNLSSGGVTIVDGQTHTIEATMTWQDNTTTSISRDFVARTSWRGDEEKRRYAEGTAAISIGGDLWTGRGGYRWDLYKTIDRGATTVYLLASTSTDFALQPGWIAKVDGYSSDAWDDLVDNTGMPNTRIAQYIEVASIRDATGGELTEPVPAGMEVKAVEFAKPLRHRYVLGELDAGGMAPRVDASYFPIEGVGIESLTLEQPENTDDLGHDDELFADGITMSAARNCWVKDVRMISVGRNPVSISGLNNEVRDCRFDGSWWTHVGQGTAYIGFGRINDSLFENLVGLHLRHAPNGRVE